jgi:hypothetical protein
MECMIAARRLSSIQMFKSRNDAIVCEVGPQAIYGRPEFQRLLHCPGLHLC